EIRVAMSEHDVDFVAVIVERVEIIRVAEIGIRLEHAFFLEPGIARQGRGRAFAEPGEDQAEIFLYGIAWNLDALFECRRLGGLLDALSGAVEHPAVIHAADAIILDPAGGKLCAAMRATRADEMRLAGEAAIERVILAHHADRLGLAFREIRRDTDRLPERLEVTASDSARPGF